MHRHFALASALRPLSSNAGDVFSTYNTSIMEGIGIRYRSQSSFATFVGRSLNELVGSKTILGGSQDKLNTEQILVASLLHYCAYLRDISIGMSCLDYPQKERIVQTPWKLACNCEISTNRPCYKRMILISRIRERHYSTRR